MREQHVLVVEDNPITRKLVRLTLGHEGFLVAEAGNGTDALALVEENTPDLVLQDLLLPDMDGFDLLTKLRALPQMVGVPIIAFSGFLSRLEHGRAADAGFSDFLPKPVEPSRLVQVVRAYLPIENAAQKVADGRRLLVVDDDAVQLKLSRILMTGMGFVVTTARDGAEALLALALERPDAVLSDVLMPNVDGFRLCAAMRADPKLAHIPVVLASSNYVEEADRRVAAAMGASAYVVRTADLAQVMEALQACNVVSTATDRANPFTAESAHHGRVLHQLERHTVMNAAYADRSALHASMLSVLAGVSEALIKSQSLDSALPDVLASLLEASGVSQGAIFLAGMEPGRFDLSTTGGYSEAAQADLARFCGQPQLFSRAAAERTPLLLGTKAGGDAEESAVLACIGTECALLIPLVADQECLGLLLLASNARDLTRGDWAPYSRTMAVQIGQALALSRAFGRLAASETRYRALVENAGDGIFSFGEDRQMRDVNPEMERILQRPRSEVVGMPVRELIAPDDRENAALAFQSLIENGEVRVFGRRLLRADGQVAICDVSVKLVKLDGSIEAVGIARDVTEKQRAEAEFRLLQTLTLAASEAPDLRSALQVVLRMICQTTGWAYGAAWLPTSGALSCDCSWTLEPALRDAYKPLTAPSISKGEGMLGKVWSSGQPRWVGLLPQLQTERGSCAAELGIRGGLAVPVLAQGEVVAVLEFLSLTAGEDARLLQLVMGAADQLAAIISRQRAQEAQRLSEARFAKLFGAGIIGIFVADLVDTIHEANDAFLDLLGLSRQELENGQVSWAALTPPEWRALDEQAMQQFATSGVAQPWEKEFLHKDGSRVPVLIGAALLDPPYSIAFVSDLSSRKLTEQSLALSQEQLRQSQKMEAVGQLAGGVAHDFNNLLSVIIGYSELALIDLDLGEPVGDHLQEIVKAGGRAAELTRQLLMFSRQQVLEPKVVDINVVLADMEKMLQRILGEDVEFVSNLQAGVGRVRIDPGSLEQVIMNLVVNARDAMPTGGRLTIETANISLSSDYSASHLGAKTGAHVLLAVSDTGLGMEKETQTRIFEPFFSTKEVGRGTGLGLSTVFGIVQASAGSIWVESEPGRGTSFKIYLPRVEAAVTAAVEAEVENILEGTQTILLVEDEDQVRALAANILRRRGYSVLEAAGSGHALLLSEQSSGPIDLLVSDVVMPLMSGPELARRLAEQRPAMKCLFMSGYTDDTIFRHGLLEARAPYLQKPLTPDNLARKVREVLGT